MADPSLIEQAWELMAVVEKDTAMRPDEQDWAWVLSPENVVVLVSGGPWHMMTPTSLFNIPIVRSKDWNVLTLAFDAASRWPSFFPHHPGDHMVRLANGDVPVWHHSGRIVVPDVINPFQQIKSGTRMM